MHVYVSKMYIHVGLMYQIMFKIKINKTTQKSKKNPKRQEVQRKGREQYMNTQKVF